MWIGKISFHGLKPALQKLTPEAYTEILPRLKFLEELPATQEGLGKWFVWEALATSDEAQIITDELGVDITVSRMRGVQSPRAAFEKTGDTFQISVANVGLLAIDHVSVLEDCCTDALQDELKKGWRIIAVCPPNDKRRPTYIIGRSGKGDD